MVSKEEEGEGSQAKNGETAKGGNDDNGLPLPDLIELATVVDPELAIVIKHPRRVQLVAAAHQRKISPSEFAKESGISLKASCGHFDALTEADFLELAETVKERGAVKHMYRATKRAYFSVIDWGKLGKKIQEGMGKAVLADINGRVTDSLERQTFQTHDDAVLYWLGLNLDEGSWSEFVKLLSWVIKEVGLLNEETAQRRARGEGQGRSFPATFGVLGFESPDYEEGEHQFTAEQAREVRHKKQTMEKAETKPKAKPGVAKKGRAGSRRRSEAKGKGGTGKGKEKGS